MQVQQQLLDPAQLLRGFTTLLQAVEWAAQMARQPQARDGEGQGGGNSGHQRREPAPGDAFTDYDEELLEDGRVIRRYKSGTIRIENPTSGVMQEERPDGSLVVSLPGGKVLYQHYRGEPLLVYDTNGHSSPGLAQVSSVNLPGHDQPAIMFHFEDRSGTHLVELETLRYYRLNQAA